MPQNAAMYVCSNVIYIEERVYEVCPTCIYRGNNIFIEGTIYMEGRVYEVCDNI